MKILIVVATLFEIEPLLKEMGLQGYADKKRISGTYKHHVIDFVVTGVGMVATAYHTGKALNKKYDTAINMGICGSFNNNLEKGTVVNVYEDCFSELGAEDGELFLTLEDLKLNGVSKVKNDNYGIPNPVIELLPKVTGITVNKVHGKETSIDAVFKKFHPYVESMEGAAFMYVCENEQIPYVQVRAVSNYVERRNRAEWNIPLAIENLNKKVIEILNQF